MPPKTRKSTRQSTLAFNPSKSSSPRITKPTASTTPTKSKAKSDTKSYSLDRPSKPSAAKKVAAEKAAIEKETKEEKGKENTAPIEPEVPPAEQKARSLSPDDIKNYYTNSILSTRRHPPLHQAEVPLDEKILRHFDLSSQYGPCTGITRVARWWRAERLGLKPPIEVLAVALEVGEREKGRLSGKEGERRGRDRRRAYIDDFLASRTAGEDK